MTKAEVKVLQETNTVIVVQPKQPLTERDFNLVSKLLKEEEKDSGVKIVLLPYSVDFVALGPNEINIDEKETAEALAKEEAEKKAKAEAEAKAKEEAEEKAKKEVAKKDKKAEKEKEADK